MAIARALCLLLVLAGLVAWAQAPAPEPLPPIPVPYVGDTPPAVTKGKLKIYLVLGSSMMFGLTRENAMSPVRPEDTAPHPRLLYFRQSGKWSDSSGDLWGQPNHVSAAELFGRALAERDPDSYIGIVAYSYFGSTLRMWTSKYRVDRMGSYVYDSLKRAADPVSKSAIRNGYGKWAGVLYVGAGGGKEDAVQAVQDWRAALGVPDLPVAITQVWQGYFDPEKPGDKGVANAVALTDAFPQGRIDYFSPETGTYSGQDSHYGRDAHAGMGRATAEAFAALARGEKVHLARGPITPVLMGTVDGPPAPTALTVDSFGRCLVLGRGQAPGPHVLARIGHEAPTPDNLLLRPRPRLLEAAWQETPAAPILLTSRDCVLAVADDRIAGWFSLYTPPAKDTKAVTTWTAGTLSGDGVRADGTLEGLTGIRAVTADGMGKLVVLAGDGTSIDVVDLDPKTPGAVKARATHPLPWAASHIAGSFGRFYALSATGDRLYMRREYEEPKTQEVKLARAVPAPTSLLLFAYQGLLVASGEGGIYVVSPHDGSVELFMPTRSRLLIGLDGPRDLLWTADRDTGTVSLYRLTWELCLTDAAGAVIAPTRPALPNTVTRVEATVKRVSALPDLKVFPPPPYKDGLLCIEYSVERILTGTLPDPTRLVGAVRAIADGRKILTPMPQPGERVVLNVTPLNADRKELLLPLADDILDLEAPLYLVVGSEAVK